MNGDRPKTSGRNHQQLAQTAGRFCRRSPRDGLRELRRELESARLAKAALSAHLFPRLALNAAETDHP